MHCVNTHVLYKTIQSCIIVKPLKIYDGLLHNALDVYSQCIHNVGIKLCSVLQMNLKCWVVHHVITTSHKNNTTCCQTLYMTINVKIN